MEIALYEFYAQQTGLNKCQQTRIISHFFTGWVVLGTLMAVTSFLIALFPKQLPRAAMRKKLKREASKVEQIGSCASLAMASTGIVAEQEGIDIMPKISGKK